ncbi:MAG TPA: anthranilate synthase component I [Candidatus Omnitrophica bacterium]|nr:anthranilate synthase component I [Candidatus Omnitrophota bacterium]
MFFPSKEDFLKLAKKGNLIPVYREIIGDLETPVSAFLKVCGESDYGYLLESVEGQEKIARYSFIGCRPQAVLKIGGRVLEIFETDNTGGFGLTQTIQLGDPLLELKKFMSKYRLAGSGESLRFCGGLVGYFGYGMARFFENIPDKNLDDKGFPDALFMLSDTLIVFDHFSRKLKIISCAFLKDNSKNAALKAYREALKKIETITVKLDANAKKPKNKVKAKRKVEIKFAITKKDFTNMVNKAKDYIRRGDIIQVVLSQVLSAKTVQSPFGIYRKLRGLNPSAYMFYLRFKDLHLAGSSPEMLVRCEEGVVTTRPIAGTSPRGETEEEDRRIENKLLNNPKEKAEHIMLVDLGRNDLGRVSKFGSVKITEFTRIERYSHVMHIVSEVRGKLKNSMDSYDVLRACFPAGTVSGSPKIRAMEIIDELENFRRGPYAGAVGYFDFSGNLDTCITIRTILINKDMAYIQAGAGIVADSEAQREYQETLNKAKAQLEAL